MVSWSHFSILVLIQEIPFVTNNVKFGSTRCLSLKVFLFFWSCLGFGLRWLYSIAPRGSTFEVTQETFFIYCFTAAAPTSRLILGLSSQTPFHQSSEVETVMSASVFVKHNLSQIPTSAEYLDFFLLPQNNFGEPSNSICGNQGGVGRPGSDSRTTFQEKASYTL